MSEELQCDICKLVECGASISSREQFQTEMIRLLCRAVSLAEVIAQGSEETS